ncbi:hypothetical protein ACFZAR_27270 [Streptomyces sp. NPDC008222]|uniref:hypothetical protein n=1 Tax=Streptomyces sp. NPDC008222 TaxID=3364820 RepID=UPI0036E3F56B
MWWTVFEEGNGWSQDRELRKHANKAGPALIVYRDKNGSHDQLMCVHRGFGKNSASHTAAEEGTSSTVGSN